MNPKVDWYFGKHERWEKEIRKLRTIALDCQLTEELKWGCPCYTLGGSNIVLIHVFKEYCALLFFKGALLKAAHKSGLQVDMKKTAEFAMPDEFRRKLRELNALKKAFHALTPGRQRGYLLYFSSAKQSKTREARIDKCLQRIMDGKGLDD